MVLLAAEFLVLCPQSNKKVNVKVECNGQPKCRYFRHVGFRGITVYVACSFGEPARKPEPPTMTPEQETLLEGEEEELEDIEVPA